MEGLECIQMAVTGQWGRCVHTYNQNLKNSRQGPFDQIITMKCNQISQTGRSTAI